MTYPDLVAITLLGIPIVIMPADTGHKCHVNYGTDHVDKGGGTCHNLHPQTGSQLGCTEKIHR